MTKPVTKPVKRAMSIPQIRVVKQSRQQSTQQTSKSNNTPNNDTDAAALVSYCPQTSLPNQQNDTDKR